MAVVSALFGLAVGVGQVLLLRRIVPRLTGTVAPRGFWDSPVLLWTVKIVLYGIFVAAALLWLRDSIAWIGVGFAVGMVGAALTAGVLAMFFGDPKHKNRRNRS